MWWRLEIHDTTEGRGRTFGPRLWALALALTALAFTDPPSAPLPVDDRPALEAAVRRLYQAYAAGDRAGVRALVPSDAVQSSWHRRRIEAAATVDCIALRELTVQVAAEGSAARLSVRATLTRHAAGAATDSVELESAEVTFRRGSSGWRIDGWRLAEEELADRLLAAASAVDRWQLLADAPELTTALSRVLAARASELERQERIGEAAVATELAAVVAETLADDSSLSLATSMRALLLRLPPADLQASLAAADRAVELAERSGDADVLAAALQRRGRVQMDLDQSPRLDVERALALDGRLADRTVLAFAAGELSAFLEYAGDHRGALLYASRTRQLAEQSGDEDAHVIARLALAGVQFSTADWDAATRSYAEAAALARSRGWKAALYLALSRLAFIYHRTDHDETALVALEEAADLARRAGRAGSISMMLRLRAEIRSSAGDLGGAEEDLVAARRAVPHPDDFGLASSFANLRLLQGRPREALAAMADVAIEPDGPTWIAVANAHVRGRAYAATGDRASAIRAYREAIAAAELDRHQVAGGARERRVYARWQAGVFQGLTDLLFADRQVDEAFVVAERSRARELLEARFTGTELEPDLLDAADRASLATLESRVATAKRALGAAKLPGSRAALDEELLRARIELTELAAVLNVKYPRPPAPAGWQPLDRAPLGRLLARERARLVEFAVTAEGVYAFLVEPLLGGDGTRLRGWRLPVSPAELRDRVAALRSAVVDRDLGYAVAARELDRLLLGFLPTPTAGGRLVIVPDGVLWSLPFATLLDGSGRSLVDRFELSFAPSATTWLHLSAFTRPAASARQASLIAFGDPASPPGFEGRAPSRLRGVQVGPLPDAEWEVRQIGRLYPGAKVLVGAAATEEAAHAQTRGRRILHFATHGALDDRDVLYSHVLLTPSGDEPGKDGFLEAWEVARLALDADLAVLSACDTGRGEVDAGEGLIGMSWALLRAGVRTTVVSQWQAESRATARLMVDFHRRMVAGASEAAALRQAQLALRQDPQYRHPFYWAPFVMVGAGG